MQHQQKSPAVRMRTYLQRIATGPEMSKPISRADACDAMHMILNQQVSSVQAGIYLIAMRMKRETDEENLGSLAALLAAVDYQTVDCDELIDIADPFNGYARGVPATPFLAAVLAACGLNAYSHGLRAVAPKYGLTHHMVYAAAGIPVDLSPTEVARRIADERIGWGYVDQSRYLPQLHRLVELRDLMVKRSCITTLEVLLGPLRATGKTHLMTGYVHKAYPPVYSLLARHANYHGAMIVRGVEGGCIPSLSQPAKFFQYHDAAADCEIRITPEQADIQQSARMIPLPSHILRETPMQVGHVNGHVNSHVNGHVNEHANQSDQRDDSGMEVIAPLDTQQAAAHCVELGMNALAGEGGAMRDSLIYGGAICLMHSGRVATLGCGAAQVRTALASGGALARFVAARANK